MTARRGLRQAVIAIVVVMFFLHAAKSEGQVTWYSSLDAPTLNSLAARFNAEHPDIALSVVQISDERLLARIMTERTAAKHVADVVSLDQLGFSQLAGAGVMAPFKPAVGGEFVKGTFDAQGRWVACFFFTDVIAWNPGRLKADHLSAPASFADFASPAWRGKFAVDANAFTWYQSVVATQSNAGDLLKRIAANQPLITNGHTATVRQLVDGEFDATPTAYGYMAEKERLANRPIAFLTPKPVSLTFHLAGLVQGAPHPDAAQVLLSWLLTQEPQQMIADSGRSPVRLGLRSDALVFSPKMSAYVLPLLTRDDYNRMLTDFRTYFGIAD
jgi:iron(III) transport system substrate-binding protein